MKAQLTDSEINILRLQLIDKYNYPSSIFVFLEEVSEKRAGCGAAAHRYILSTEQQLFIEDMYLVELLSWTTIARLFGTQKATLNKVFKRVGFNHKSQFIKNMKFIRQAIQAHSGILYDYSPVRVIGAGDYVTINCKQHGCFEVRCNHHIHRLSGCKQCFLANKHAVTIEAFKNTHGTRFDYSQFVFEGQSVLCTIICSKHGPFLINPTQHIEKSMEVVKGVLRMKRK